MEKEIFKEKMQYFLNLYDLNLDDEKINKFYLYMKLLIEWNEKINLTAIVDEEEIILKHFVDSLTISKYINDNEKVIDVGTGAGFPGIPLKIANPSIQLVLVDSLNKRINFLNEVIEKLKLDGVKTVHSRIEDCGKSVEFREKFDISTARAVANISVLSEYLIPFTKIGGRCIFMKGQNIEDELKDGENAIKKLGAEIEEINQFKLANTDINRNVLIVKKVKNTPKEYPRKAGIPSKSPIK